MDTHAWNLLDADDKAAILKGMSAGREMGPPRLMGLEWSRRQWLPDATGGRRRGRPGDEMDLYTLQMLIEEMEEAGVKGLVLEGEGDPLEHRSIESILKELSGLAIPLGFLETGGLSLRGKKADLLARVLRGTLVIRLETGSAEDCAERLAVPGQGFREALDHLRAWNGSRPPASECRTVVRFVLTPANCTLLREMTELAVEAGADGIQFVSSRREADAPAFLERRREFLEEARLLGEADHEGRVESIEPPHPLMSADLQRIRATNPRASEGPAPGGGIAIPFKAACLMPWLGLSIAPNGAAHPCRRALEREATPVGNIHAQPLARLWKGRPLRVMRRTASRAPWTVDACPACRGGEPPIIPCAQDHGFLQELDSLLRGGLERSIRFPDRLRDREWSTVTLPLRRLWPWRSDPEPQVRVDGVPVGVACGGIRGIAIRFRPDDLPRGFHLVEVVDRSGRLLGARLVEKTGG